MNPYLILSLASWNAPAPRHLLSHRAKTLLGETPPFLLDTMPSEG